MRVCLSSRRRPASKIKRTEAMGAYKPSTLIDFEAGRPLEVEAIWGEPLRRGLAAGAEMPELAALYSELKRIDETRQLHATQGVPEPKGSAIRVERPTQD